MLPHISVISPVYRGADCVKELVARIRSACEQITPHFEIILVEDSGPDQSWERIVEEAALEPRLKGYRLSRNFGQHYAIAAGLSHAKGEWVVVMDCDLQDRPEEIPKLYRKAQEGYEAVVARRAHRRDGLLKIFSSNLFYTVLSWLSGTEQNSEVANFGIYHRKLIAQINGLRENFRYFPVMVRWVGFKRVEIEVQHASREIGRSSYNFKRLLSLAFEILVAFSDKPLRLTVILGAFMAFISFCFGTYLLVSALLGFYTIQGWASLMISLWFLSGMIIFVMGVVGIYVGRCYRESKGRPNFIIAEETSGE